MLCRVELHFASCPFVPILGFSSDLTISPSFSSGCFLLFFEIFCKCQLTQRWFHLFPSFIRLDLSNAMLSRIICVGNVIYMLYPFSCICFNGSSLLYKLYLHVMINLSTVCAWVLVWTDLISLSWTNLFILADLIEYCSYEYNCFGFPIEVNIFFKPSIMASGVLFVMATTSAIVVRLSIAPSPYRVLEVAPFDYISIKSISNSYLLPG